MQETALLQTDITTTLLSPTVRLTHGSVASILLRHQPDISFSPLCQEKRAIAKRHPDCEMNTGKLDWHNWMALKDPPRANCGLETVAEIECWGEQEKPQIEGRKDDGWLSNGDTSTRQTYKTEVGRDI